MSKEPQDHEIEKQLEVTFKIQRILARAYLFSLRRREASRQELRKYLQISSTEAESLITQIFERGWGIESTKKDVYKVLHPRMGLTNSLNLLYPDLQRRPKEIRKVIDRLAARLTMIYENV